MVPYKLRYLGWLLSGSYNKDKESDGKIELFLYFDVSLSVPKLRYYIIFT
jgi:hypothetical protein